MNFGLIFVSMDCGLLRVARGGSGAPPLAAHPGAPWKISSKIIRPNSSFGTPEKGLSFGVRNVLVIAKRVFASESLACKFKDNHFFRLCVCARSLTKPFFHPSQPGSCAWLLPFLLCADCTRVLVCVCLCM